MHGVAGQPGRSLPSGGRGRAGRAQRHIAVAWHSLVEVSVTPSAFRRRRPFAAGTTDKMKTLMISSGMPLDAAMALQQRWCMRAPVERVAASTSADLVPGP